MAGKVSVRRFLSEGILIIVSILAAFGIQAWWENRMEREQERRLLSALLEESRAIVPQLERNVAFHEAITASSDILLRAPLAPTGSFTADSLDRLIGDLTWARSVDFQTGSLNSVLLGGRLALISEPDVRSRIAEWQGALDEIADVAVADWELVNEDVRGFIREHGSLPQLQNAMRFNPGSPEPLNMEPLPLPTGPQDHFRLLALESFRNLVLERRWAQDDMLAPDGYPNLVSSHPEMACWGSAAG